MTSVILINYRSQAEFDRRDLAVDLSETLIKANIPVEKLDHPAFMDFIKRRVPGGGAIPSASSARQWYLPTVQKAHDIDLKAVMSEADGVIITVDESSDNVTERSVLNLVFTPITVKSAQHKLVSYIADQVYVDELDHKVVARETIRVIDKFDIHHDKIISYVCDNVAYMSKAFTIISPFYENCVLITCTAHLFHLLFERLSLFGNAVHQFMLKWRVYFKNSVQRKKRFSSFIESKGLTTVKCPKPCTTRWTPWLKAVLWHSERHRHLEEFLESERGLSDSTTAAEIINLFSTELEDDFTYLGSVVPTLIDAIESVETNSVSGHHLIEKLIDLKAFLKTQMRSRAHSIWRPMWQEILDKFETYFEWSGTPPTY